MSSVRASSQFRVNLDSNRYRHPPYSRCRYCISWPLRPNYCCHSPYRQYAEEPSGAKERALNVAVPEVKPGVPFGIHWGVPTVDEVIVVRLVMRGDELRSTPVGLSAVKQRVYVVC